MTTWFAPGRIEVLGKHTDYAGGNSLLMALDRGVTVRVTPASSGITARTSALPGEVDLARSGELAEGHWGRYLHATVVRLTRNFGPLAPCEIQVDSTLPLASGMSSSSALVVATALALARFNRIDEEPRWTGQLRTPEALASYLACIENGSSYGSLAGDKGVGTFGGSEDHTAMACCRPEHVSQYRFDPIVRHADIRLSGRLTYVVATSGVLAEKTGSARDAYNRASLTAREVVRRWNDHTGRTDATIGQAVLSDGEAADRLTALVRGDAALSTRLRHFLSESEVLVPAAARALASKDLAGLGAICDESQRLAATLLGNQTAETTDLAGLARSLGAHAATAFGAGFGGSVWALVNAADADAFGRAWLDRYVARHPQHATASSVLASRPCGPTAEVSDTPPEDPPRVASQAAAVTS